MWLKASSCMSENYRNGYNLCVYSVQTYGEPDNKFLREMLNEENKFMGLHEGEIMKGWNDARVALGYDPL